MPPLGLSAGMRKARDLGGRTLSLAFARPRMIVPAARYPARPHDAILVLQRGENASTDYYLTPRLEGAEPSEVADIQSSPSRSRLLCTDSSRALFVILCRYVTPAWLNALEAVRDRLARGAFFMDDDLPGMMRDVSLPLAARGKVARYFGDHVERLEGLVSEVWVSTTVLAERYPEAHPAVIGPLPEADPPEPSLSPPRRVVYHGADVHGRERRFVAEVAGQLAALSPDAEVEIAGDSALRKALRARENITVTPQTPWRQYLDRQSGRQAAVSLAPLEPSAVNLARASVKVFDAARLGAAGIYADAEPYRRFVRHGVDGLLLPMDPTAWAEAIAGLLTQPERRLELARAARARLLDLRRGVHSFPEPPPA